MNESGASWLLITARIVKTFRERCCEELGIPPEAFEEEVLWRCLYPDTVWLGKLLWQINPRCFDPDIELIQQVSDCTTASEMRAELNDFRYHQPVCGFLRKVLRIRLSGQRLVDFASKLLPEGNHE